MLLGEVSPCDADNCFEPPMGRFPIIEEDEAPYRALDQTANYSPTVAALPLTH